MLAVALTVTGLVTFQAGQAGAQQDKFDKTTTNAKGAPGGADFGNVRTEKAPRTKTPRTKISADQAAQQIFVSAPSSSTTLNGTRIDAAQTLFLEDNGQVIDTKVVLKKWTATTGWDVDWQDLGKPDAGIYDMPSITWTPAGNRLDVFVVGDSDFHTYQKAWNAATGWTGWVDLGGEVLTTVSGAWTANGNRLDVFGFGTDGRLYQKAWNNGSGWTGWVGFEPPPGGFASSPGITWTANGARLDVFAAGGPGHALFQKSWNAGSGWTGWVGHGGALANGTSPSASWIADGSRIDVFVTGTDNKLYQKVWSNTTSQWRGYFGFDGPAAGNCCTPAITWAANGSRLDVLVTALTNGHLNQKAWTNTTGWKDWVDADVAP